MREIPSINHLNRIGLIAGGFATRFTASTTIISGFAYPGNTLTSTRTGQWFVGGVAQVGQTGTSFVVPLTAIGQIIQQANSNVLTCWHPNQIPAVARFWIAERNAFNSISPDTLAADGQTVRRWNDIISSTQANQTNSINQPIYRATGQSGNPSLEFDGSNDFLSLPANSDVLQNKSQAYIFAGVRDTNPTAGDGSHIVCQYSVNTGFGSGARLGLASRRGGNNFQAIARRRDNDAITVADRPNTSSFTVLGAHGDFSSGMVRLRINGDSISYTALAGGSGNTSDTASTFAGIGQDGSGAANHLPGHVVAVSVVNSTISTSDLAKLEKYIGLLGGVNNQTLVNPINPTPTTLAMWGDSLTQAQHLGFTDSAATTRIKPPAKRWADDYSLPVYSLGYGGQTTAQITARIQEFSDLNDCIAVIWGGTNDQDNSNAVAVVDAISAAVSHIGHNRFVVVTPLINPTWTSAQRTNVTNIRSEIISRFPNNHLDSWSVANTTSGTPNIGFRRFNSAGVEDAFHPNDNWYPSYITTLKSFIDTKGWLA